VGDRVTLEPGVPDLVCEQCRAGRYNLCPNVRFFATPPIDGAFARFVTIHEAFAYALPEELTLEQGALMEPLSVGVWACRKGGVGPGSRVLVSGAGPIGNLAAQVALAAGATRSSSRTSAPTASTSPRGSAPRACSTCPPPHWPSPGSRSTSCSSARAIPRRSWTGSARSRRPAPPSWSAWARRRTRPSRCRLIQNRELWLTGTFRYANTYPTAIALAAQGRVDLEIIMTGRYGLDEAEAALRAPREDPLAIKPMVFPGG
jgi:L-iditol 2-dehydrogenase